ncbi:hypothetical protein CFII68_12919 [Pseudomonas sp. CFII68]|nr:hypothetical protein CFII68_12919 [Pseudomonas sp. CFII68]
MLTEVEINSKSISNYKIFRQFPEYKIRRLTFFYAMSMNS